MNIDREGTYLDLSKSPLNHELGSRDQLITVLEDSCEDGSVIDHNSN